MKKNLLLFGACLAFNVALFAQVDTLNNHFTGTLSLYSSQGGGYTTGNNGYGDIAKMQLFDGNYGVTGSGTITNVLLAVAIKDDAGTGGTFKVKLWENNAGAPGTELGSVVVQMAQVDTAVAAFQFGTGFLYNVNAQFNVAVPTGNAFWAGVELPTGNDSIALYCTKNGDFPDAETHTGEFWDDGSFHTFGDPQNWNSKIALGIFPVVNFGSGVGLSENQLGASVYPNPAKDALNFKLNENASAIEIITMDGKVVVSNKVNSTAGSVDISALENGMYIYNITTDKGAKSTGTFVKK